MSLLPTAHAGQSYGSRRIDFFTVSGQVSASDANTGRVTDPDGLEHDVRLVEQTSAFAPGDSATILRVQSGPNRRSRPVAIVNHTRGVWMRAAPDATSILARSGVTRSFNWWLSILAMVLTAAVAVWPTLHVFLTEINAGMMAGVPAFNAYDEILAQMPGLASWRMETALPSGIVDAIAGLGFIPMEQLTELSMFALAALLATLAFASRSWRLLYIPVFAGFTLLAGALFGAAETSLIILAGGLALFMAGGLVNRIRDSGRLNSRVERLAEHVLRNPPQEEVRAADLTATPVVAGAAVAATALAAEAEPVTEIEITDVSEPTDETLEEAGGEAEEGPVPTVDAVNEIADPADAETATLDAASGETDAPGSSGTEASEEAAAEDTSVEVTSDERAEEDDLPSLEAVAAAAALNESEQAEAGAGTAIEIDLEDESTLPVAPPPPMPAPANEVAAEGQDETVSPETVETSSSDENSAAGGDMAPVAELADDASDSAPETVMAAADATDASDAVDAAPMAVEEVAAAANAEAVETSATVPAPVDDPMLDDAHDPMTASAADNDFAPGAPEIEVEAEPRPAE